MMGQGMDRGGFGDLLRQRMQQPQSPVIASSTIPQETSPQQMIQDPLVRRYYLYAELYSIGDVKDKEYVRSAVKIEELAQVIRTVLPNSPRAIALEYVAKYKGNVLGLLKEVLEREQLPNWLKTLIDIALGGGGGRE